MIYDIERYNELQQIIEQKQLYKIGNFRDYPIIRNSDLKDKLLEVYLQIDCSNHKELLDNFEDIMAEIIGENNLIKNKKFLWKYVRDLISNGCLIEEIEDLFTEEQQEQLIHYFLKKVKEPGYQIKGLTEKFIKNEEFIQYCFNNKNLSIINFIEYKEEYANKALELIKEGHGFDLTSKKYEKILLKPLLEAGYLNNFNKVNNNIQEINDYLKIVKDQIRKGKKYTMSHPVNYESVTKDQELIELLIETNQLDFINVISNTDISADHMKKIIEKIKNGYQFKNISTSITNSELLKVLLETNQTSCINSVGIQALNDNLKLFKKKLKEFHFINLNILYDMIDLIKKDSELLTLLSENNIENLLVIMNYINHHEDLLDLYNEEFYQATKNIISKYYHLNIEHLNQFVSKFGLRYLYYIENKNMRDAINLPEEDFQKYMALFSNDNLNLTNVQNIYDSIIQTRFKKEYEIDINRLTRIKNSITDSNLPFPLEDLTILANKIDIKELKKLQLLSEEELIQLNQNALVFLTNIYNKIKNKENIDKNLTIIYEINRQYLRKKREEYRASHHYEEELNLNSDYDENSLLNVLITDLASSLTVTEQIISLDHLYYIIDYYISSDFNPLVDPTKAEENKEKIKQCLIFIKSKGQEFNTKETKKTLKELKEILRFIIKNQTILAEFKANIAYSNYNVKKIYKVPNNNFQIFSILQEINPNELKDTVFSNDKVYQELQKLLQKYKFTKWQDIFKQCLAKSNLTLESYDVAAMITKFNELYKHIEKKQKNKEEVNLPEIINFSNILSSSSNRYAILLGEEDANLIKLNPGPNFATITGDSNSRLDKAIANILKLYQKKEITTPPINEEIMVNNKKININLGNFTNPINVTYGERTGACMRIMGVGESLYRFCQENENAFHIRLTDSETGKFISRVSGFRNGNSIFLNELRYSVEPDLYSNEEVIKAIKQVSQMLIDKSKDSSIPIDNIFITHQYAMENDTTSKIIEIKENIKEGLPSFYFDLHETGVILATTSKDKDYVPINTNKEGLPKYPVVRDKIREFIDKQQIFNQVNKIHLLNEMITKQDPTIFYNCDLISSEQTESIIYMLSGEDWIACLDKNLNIHTSYIPRGDDKAINELNTAIEILIRKKEEKEQNESTNRTNNRI